MGDALCLMFVPPTTDSGEHYPVTTAAPATATTTTTNGERSSFRRSLTLSNGAFGLRRFSRSMFTESTAVGSTTNNNSNNTNNNNTNTNSSSNNNNNNTSHRRSTISTAIPNTKNLRVRIVPNIENPSRSLIFDIFDRDLEPGVYIKIGRFTDRSHSTTNMSFKSKVVSRAHCELWVENEKLFIRDTKSSSGTFLNHARISPPNQESLPYEVKDGDIVQLGVDYQGGIEEIYRSVKMRFEVNRSRRQRPVSFNMTAFQNIRNLTNGGALIIGGGGGVGPSDADVGTSPLSGNQIQDQAASEPLTVSLNPSSLPPSLPAESAPGTLPQDSLHADSLTEQHQQHQRLTTISATIKSSIEQSTRPEPTCGIDDLEECCICLYALAPHQALFVSPCAHTYHYKCIRPLLESYPGFQCPICRTYSDLDASINLESHEILEKYGLQRQSTIIDPTSAITSVTTTQPQQGSHLFDENDTSVQNLPLCSSIIHNSNNHGMSNISVSQSRPTLDTDDDMAPLATLQALEHMDDNTQHTCTLSESSARDRRQTVVVEDTTASTSGPTQHVNNENSSSNSETETNDHSQPRSVTPDNHIVEDRLETQDISTSQDPTRNRRSVIVDDNVRVIPGTMDTMDDTTPHQPPPFLFSPSSTSSPGTEQQQEQHSHQRRVNASGFVEKLKMVLFEKRKSSVIVAPRERKRTNRPRPLSYPHFLRRHYDEEEVDDGHTDDEENYDNDNNNDGSGDTGAVHPSTTASSNRNIPVCNNSSSLSASHNLSRQSTTHLAEIEEEEYPWHHHFSQYQPMSIDG